MSEYQTVKGQDYCAGQNYSTSGFSPCPLLADQLVIYVQVDSTQWLAEKLCHSHIASMRTSTVLRVLKTLPLEKQF